MMLPGIEPTATPRWNLNEQITTS